MIRAIPAILSQEKYPIFDRCLANSYTDFHFTHIGTMDGRVGQCVGVIRGMTKLRKISIMLKKTGTPFDYGALRLSIYATSGTIGTNAVFTGSEISHSDKQSIDVTSIYSWVDFSFSNLAVSGSMAFMLYPFYGDDSNYFSAAVVEGSAHYGNLCGVTSSGSIYANSTKDLLFKLYGCQ